MTVDLDDPGEHAEWARIIEAKTRENKQLRARALAAEAMIPKLQWSLKQQQRAVDIARRALVEGLAECERLRAMRAKLLATPRETCAVLAVDEQAIRADERRVIAEWLRGLASQVKGSYPEANERRYTLDIAADDIEMGHHRPTAAALRAGGGGGDA